MPNFANNLKGNNRIMKVEEIDLDDEGTYGEQTEEQNFNEDTYEKPWLTNQEEEPFVANSSENTPDESTSGDVVTAFLRDRGINPDSIKLENDKGEIEEIKFNDLSQEEQLEVLKYNNEDVDYGLGDDEINFINELRTNNLSIDEYVAYQKRKAVEDYLASNGEETSIYEIDTIPDDELYIADLKAKIPELSEEDAAAELDLAKQNETLYQKKIQSIRNEYKQKEDSLAADQEAEAATKAAEEFEAFENEIVTAIQENDTIDLGESSLTLSEDDMNEIASYILDEDATGVRHIAKALNDPKTIVGMVWYALKGKEAFGQISEYYRQKITEASRTNYQKGFDDAKTGKPASKSVVKKPTDRPTATPKQTISINDLD